MRNFVGMKKITFLLSRFLDGGIDTVLLDYLRNLSTCEDYSITLAISTDMGELEVFRDEVPTNVKVVHLIKDGVLTRWRKQKVVGNLPFVAKLTDELLLAPIRRLIIGRKLRALAQQCDVMIDFDCCHYSFINNVRASQKDTEQTTLVAWWHFSFEHRMENDHRRMQRIGRHLANYDRVVTISKAMLEEGERLFPQMAGKWRLIYNAKDEERLQRLSQEPVDDERINKPYILAVERLEESQKDLTTLIKAYALLKERMTTNVKLYLLGKGRDESQLRVLATTLGVHDDVEFLGFHSNPYPWIAKARFIAHSAKMEGLPTAMIESLIMGKLIVSTDCPTGPREILDDGKAGLLVPVGDAPAMADALQKLLTDETLKGELLRHAQEHRRCFLFESTRKQFDEVIRNEK